MAAAGSAGAGRSRWTNAFLAGLSAPTAAVSPCPPDTQASFRSRVASPPTHRERREGGNHSSGAKVVEHAGGVGSAQHLPAALPPGQVAITAAVAALAASEEALGLPAGTARAAALEQALLTVGKARALSGEVRTKYRSTHNETSSLLTPRLSSPCHRTPRHASRWRIAGCWWGSSRRTCTAGSREGPAGALAAARIETVFQQNRHARRRRHAVSKPTTTHHRRQAYTKTTRQPTTCPLYNDKRKSSTTCGLKTRP